MHRTDVDHLKSELPKIHNPFQELQQIAMTRDRPRFPYRRAVGEMLQPFFTRGGVDIAKLDKLSLQNQEELRRISRRREEEVARYAAAAAAAFRQGQEDRRKAFELLANLPFVPRQIMLDRAVLILETPKTELDKFIDSHNSSFDNWVKINIDTNGGSDNTQFSFYFMWENESDSYAVVNVDASLILNGSTGVTAATGFFSGDTAELYSTASLSVLRWSGWGTDPVTGNSLDGTYAPLYQQSQSQTVEYLHVEGGGLFGDVGQDAKMFAYQPFDLNYHVFPVPGRAVTIFQVGLSVGYDFGDGGNISDNVTFDFASDDKNYSVQCPFMQLEVLTA